MFPRLICLLSVFAVSALAQQVTLPLPRLLTIMPMGGQAGQSVEVTITGENIEDVTELAFSTTKITAQPVAGAVNKFTVSIAADAPVGVYDARVMSRLGVSSVRAFSVNKLPEVVRTKANNTLETALPLTVGSICNATMTKRAVDFYSFQGVKGQAVAIDCAAVGIDSRLTPVLILADGKGADLKVNRTGGMIDFTPPADGSYIIKVSDLTYQGGERHFYRLALQKSPAEPQPQTQTVSAMSWPPAGLAASAAAKEVEPNNKDAQKISLPCDIGGAFFPAADVDTYEFTAKKGETWWVEVASERLGRNTDPFVLVQQVKDGKFTDVAELYDIAPPMKVTSNGYSYDGPPYDAGSPDVLGKFEVKEDGTYRLQVRDLFGGTRSDPHNVYRLLVRQAAPDFSLAAWAVHMTLRNGDRASLSKPMALRQGDARAFEVVVQRRDGFDGEIEIAMEGLPQGVSAAGLKIAKGKTYGHLIVTADEKAPRGFSLAKITGKAVINGKEVTHPVRLASMEWPVKDAKGEIPAPRLMADIPVSVTDSEQAPLSITLAENKVFEAKAGETLKIPLKLAWRNEFNGTSIKVKAYGEGFSAIKEFDIPLKAATHELALNLAELKIAPGDYTFALQSLGICKYRYNPAAVPLAEAEQKKAEAALAAAAAEAKKIAATDAEAAKKAAEKQKAAEAAMTAATTRMKSVTTAANPTDTVEILISQPIRVSVKPAAPTTAAK
ncbi:MAG TPA: serine protease [Verrucomicrobiales bacterium]|nr:serine protease [Verrucomicrobiales bacterium]HRJ09395.1 PPC domain-containing protein [Prosthecobacter sp.]HRK13270.1 PPC domain-containing protein [Prosthecobacter sp.]